MQTEQIVAILIQERDKINRAIDALQGPMKRRVVRQGIRLTPLLLRVLHQRRRSAASSQPPNEKPPPKVNAPKVGCEEEIGREVGAEERSQAKGEGQSSLAGSAKRTGHVVNGLLDFPFGIRRDVLSGSSKHEFGRQQKRLPGGSRVEEPQGDRFHTIRACGQ